ncbi:scavenger receptor cysteine-rich type 1 protein M160-like isoform X2 [Liolophura sinensis]|uniref:scavenger receptor cysteine-rich type 1 protein M160-like isoform X2 n=1 Tax=Liolophura sinensis TaxID=3198878 RepID=UPI0031595356
MIINLTTGFLLKATLLTLSGNGTGFGFLEYKGQNLQVSQSSALLKTNHLYKICLNLDFRGYPLFKLLIRSSTTETVYRVDRCSHSCYDLYLECNVEFPYRLDESGDIRLFFEAQWSALCFNTALTFEQASEFCEKFNLPSYSVEVLRGSFGTYQNSWKIGDSCSSKIFNNCTSIRRLTTNACTAGTLAAIKCKMPAPEFRLLDWGETRHRGTLEVKVGETWNQVCSKGFTLDDARVACRTLGYPSSDANYHRRKYSLSRFTRYSGQFRCTGSEASLTDCPGLEEDYKYCYSAYVTDISCTEAQEGKLRLTGGYDGLSGRLEVFHNNTWGPVCNNSFGEPEISTACNQISSGRAKKGKHIRGVGVLPHLTASDIMLNGLDCAWIQSRLLDCPHYIWGIDTCHTSVVYLSCTEERNLFRLVDGDGSYGRLEVYHDSQWGTICKKTIGENEAKAACETLGLSNLLARVGTSGPGQRSTRIWLDKLICESGTKHLKNCVLGTWGEVASECSNEMDLVIYCEQLDKSKSAFYIHGDPSYTNEIGIVAFSYYSTDFSVRGDVCMEAPSDDIAVVACRTLGLPTKHATLLSETVFPRINTESSLNGVKCNGQEMHLLNCQFSSMKQVTSCKGQNKLVVACGLSLLPDYTLRLVNEYSTTSGRLQVLMHGVWGSVCENGFDSKSAEVACRKLGLSTSSQGCYRWHISRSPSHWRNYSSCVLYR